ncbi:hypothetical protein [Rhizobium bangladeshense]|uniref:hypothetical protein n=1 Tax=Rhizobium bangladeshense TaxID=1138189 RepID=UPI001C832BE4|nr:hypothetical protein [Rhizobium bangladeshense]MBX4898602.1 hypothetical protein [Rhizobium bangladeshense]
MENVTPLKPAAKMPAEREAAPSDALETELRQIGKRGAVKFDQGKLTIEHPTWMKAVGTDYVRLSEVIAEQMVILAASNQNAVDQSELTMLRTKGILSVQETNELLDEALAFIEQLQLKAPAHEQWIYDLARGHVEAALPAVGGGRKRAK